MSGDVTPITAAARQRAEERIAQAEGWLVLAAQQRQLADAMERFARRQLEAALAELLALDGSKSAAR